MVGSPGVGGSCTRSSIFNLRGGIVTRGIVFDIPRLKGVPYLEPGSSYTACSRLARKRTSGAFSAARSSQ